MNKKMLKAASVLLVVGLALYLVGISASASKPKVMVNAATEITYQAQDYAVQAGGVTEIKVITRNMPVTVSPSNGDEITIRYYTADEDPYEVSLERGVLTLKYEKENLFSSGSWFTGSTIFNGFNQNPMVEVVVPKAFAGALNLNTSNASVNVSGLTDSGDMTVVTSNGTVKLADLTAAQIRVTTSNSSLELIDIHSSLVKATTSNGRVNAEKLIVSGDVELRSSNGSVSVRQAAAKDRLTVNTSNGRVTVDQITASNIDLRSSNSGISGSVAGRRADYTISSDTSNADNNLNSGGSGRCSLTVNTSNGAIDIRFLND